MSAASIARTAKVCAPCARPAYDCGVEHALNAAGASVSFAEIVTDKGHDAFLLEEPELFEIVRGFLEAAARGRGLKAKR